MLGQSPRPYREEALRRWQGAGRRRVVVLPAGAGNTHVALLAIRATPVHTLIVVPALDLIEQWRRALIDKLGAPPEHVSTFGGGRYDLGPITVMTYDSAAIHTRARHGDRFARAVLEMLRVFPALEGTARVLVNEREYVLRLPRGLGEAIRSAPAEQPEPSGPPEVIGDDDTTDGDDHVTATVRRATDDVRFDSTVERHLYDTLRGVERRGDTRGWTVERESEPIIHGPTVLVPDFVVGGADDLVLVVQDQLAPDFEPLPFAVLTYKCRPAAEDLIRLLERSHATGSAPRDPLAAIRSRLEDDDLLAGLLSVCRRHVPAEGLSLERLSEHISQDSASHSASEHLDVLLPRVGYEVRWDSLFDATVRALACPAAQDRPGAD